MSVVPLAIAHSFVDKKSTKFEGNKMRVVNLMECRPGVDRMQEMLLVCRTCDIRVDGRDVTIDSNPAFMYLNEAVQRKLGVQAVFYVLADGCSTDIIRHSSTEEFSFEYALLAIGDFEIITVDQTARAVQFLVRFV